MNCAYRKSRIERYVWWPSFYKDFCSAKNIIYDQQSIKLGRIENHEMG